MAGKKERKPTSFGVKVYLSLYNLVDIAGWCVASAFVDVFLLNFRTSSICTSQGVLHLLAGKPLCHWRVSTHPFL